MKKIIVTGGNGFLGSYVVKELLKAGNDVTILTNKKTKLNLPVKFIFSDITNKEKLIKKIKNFDTVYHLAGILRTPKTDIKELQFTVNSEGTRNILEACRANNIKRFIFISTVEVYGDRKKENIKENEKKIPSNYYAKSKLLAEAYCLKYAQKYNMTITVVRPSYIYGYGQYAGRLFPRLISDALDKRKTELRPFPDGNDFIYVKDAASAIVLLGGKKQISGFENYNISSGKFMAIEEIFKTIKSLTGFEYKDSNIIDKNIRKISFSVGKAKRAGYRPRFDLKRGLADYINYQNKS